MPGRFAPVISARKPFLTPDGEAVGFPSRRLFEFLNLIRNQVLAPAGRGPDILARRADVLSPRMYALSLNLLVTGGGSTSELKP